MEKENIIEIISKILKDNTSGMTKLTESLEFFRVYVGEHSNFYKQLQEIPKISGTDGFRRSFVDSVLDAYLNYLKNGLETGVSMQRRIQIDTVSDILNQANDILSNEKLHPASACVIIGAALEEFLRNWVEEQSLSLGNNKPSLDLYSKILREADIITKQDAKDITSWSGLRNHAAHGEWDEVKEKQRIGLMLEGVNLFMRKYSIKR